MKRLLLLGFIGMLAMHVWAQQAISEEEVPEAVQKTFQKKFGRYAKKIAWEKEKTGNYVVYFKSRGSEMAAVYDDQGEWLETSTEYDPKRVSYSIRKYVEKNYAGYKINWAAKVNNSEKERFMVVELTKKKEQSYALTMTLKGELVKEEAVSE